MFEKNVEGFWFVFWNSLEHSRMFHIIWEENRRRKKEKEEIRRKKKKTDEKLIIVLYIVNKL